jgi:hypothetical protein
MLPKKFDHSFKESVFPYQLTKITDFLYHEGPLTSLFKSPLGDFWIYDWADCCETHNRWICFKTDIQSLKNFRDLKKGQWDLINGSSEIWIIDLDDDLNKTSHLVSFDEIPLEYLPKKTSLYQPDHYEKDGNLFLTLL